MKNYQRLLNFCNQIQRLDEKYNYNASSSAMVDDMNKFITFCYPLNPKTKNVNLELSKVISILKYKQEILTSYLLCEKGKTKIDYHFVNEYLQKIVDKHIYVLDELRNKNCKEISLK